MSAAKEGKANGGSAVTVVVKALVIVALVTVALLVWVFVQRPAQQPQKAQALPVQTIRAKRGTLEKTMVLDSYLASDSVVTVLPKVSGTLLTLSVDVGSPLQAGELVAKIDPQPYEIALNQAKAAFDGATSLYERQKQLYASGATSQQNFDSAQTQFENAKSQYELAKLNLSYTTITSPVEGTVVQRHVSRGAMVSQSVPIVTISNTDALVIRSNVPERYARLFHDRGLEMEISASIPAMGLDSHRLRIRTMSPAIDVRSKTFSVECEILGDTSGILPGMFSQVTFVLESKDNVLYLPFTALVGGNTLWYVGSDGTARFITVESGFHNDAFFELPSEYQGYDFILAGQHFLSGGTPVRKAESGQAAQ